VNNILPWTNIVEFIDVWECRYIDPKEFRLNMEIVVYNNVMAMYMYKAEKISCVEMYNECFAETQKIVFDYFWGRGKKMKKTDNRGCAVVGS